MRPRLSGFAKLAVVAIFVTGCTPLAIVAVVALHFIAKWW